MATITCRGFTVQTDGDFPVVGQTAPPFELVDKDLNDIPLSHFNGKKTVLSIVPSLDTKVCPISTIKFNKMAEQFPGVNFVVISADLPFAMDRFCVAENLENITSLSMMRSKQFGTDYGVLMLDGPMGGITARAVLVLDEAQKVIHGELVENTSNEPDYDAVEAALSR